MPPVLSLTFDSQAAMAEDPDLSAIREFTLSLDVPQVARADQPFARLRQAASASTAPQISHKGHKPQAAAQRA